MLEGLFFWRYYDVVENRYLGFWPFVTVDFWPISGVVVLRNIVNLVDRIKTNLKICGIILRRLKIDESAG